MATADGLGRVWGMTDAERSLVFPCDALLDSAEDDLCRGVTVHAPPALVFRWLCQLRVAPYSYDWIDNFGRRSPPHLIAGLDRLAVGQHVMSIFDLVAFERDRHITLRIRPNTTAFRLFGELVGTYAVASDGPHTRLLVKLRVRYPRGPSGAVMRRVLPLGDLIMMRRQLLNLKALAEATTALDPATSVHVTREARA